MVPPISQRWRELTLKNDAVDVGVVYRRCRMVMAPNVIGMGMYADGGWMSTKPYVSGGNYISKMTDFCGDCSFDRKARTGDEACRSPLYWDSDRNRDVLRSNHRMARLRELDRLSDIEEVRERAVEVQNR